VSLSSTDAIARCSSRRPGIRQASGVEVTPVVADISTPEGQEALLAACPAPDILINNNGGPPFRDFRELDRPAMLTGVTMTCDAHRAHSKSHRLHGGARLRPNRQYHLHQRQDARRGLDLSSASRAGLTAFVAGVAAKSPIKNVTINNLLPEISTPAPAHGFIAASKHSGESESIVAAQAMAQIPAKRFGTLQDSARLRLPVQRACRVHDRTKYSAGRGVLPRSFLIDPGAF